MPASSNPLHSMFLQSIVIKLYASYLLSALRQVPIALQLRTNIPRIFLFTLRLIVVPPSMSILHGFVDSWIHGSKWSHPLHAGRL